jgi:riboflavin kinase/FMN adenylyltransferase
MHILRSLDDLPGSLRGGAVSIGNFDGVHRGHARIAERLVAHAKETGGPAIAFTFDPHPLALLKPEIVPVPMTRIERKAELLGELGLDAVIAYPTNQALLSLSPEEFFQQILRDKLGAKAIVEGPNFHFGRGRAGDVEVLGRLCAAASVKLEVVEPLEQAGEIVSSSRVRAMIVAGQIGQANQLVTRPYQLNGIVGHGAARGAKIGFPTANLEQVQTALPGPGVYVGRAWITGPRSGDRSQGSVFPAAVNVGPNPTFGEQAVKIEVHLIDFSGDLYGQPLKVDFLDRLRDVQPFPSVDALIAQLRRDVAEVREYCTCSSS